MTIILIVHWKYLEKTNSRNTFTNKDNEFEKSETPINRFTCT